MNITEKLRDWYNSHFNHDSREYKTRVIARELERQIREEPLSLSLSTILYVAATIPIAVAGVSCKKSYETDKQTPQTIADLCADVAKSCDYDVRDECKRILNLYEQGSYHQRKLIEILTKVAKEDELDKSALLQFFISLTKNHQRISDERLLMEFEEFVYGRLGQELTVCNYLRAVTEADKERNAKRITTTPTGIQQLLITEEDKPKIDAMLSQLDYTIEEKYKSGPRKFVSFKDYMRKIYGSGSYNIIYKDSFFFIEIIGKTERIYFNREGERITDTGEIDKINRLPDNRRIRLGVFDIDTGRFSGEDLQGNLNFIINNS
jgi:hypothetical protein